MMCYLKIRNNDLTVTYGLVTGVKTFEWNGKRYWIWHKERGRWYLVDYDTGLTIIRASTRRGVQEKMDDQLWDRLKEVYEKDFYKKEVEHLEEYRKADAVSR